MVPFNPPPPSSECSSSYFLLSLKSLPLILFLLPCLLILGQKLKHHHLLHHHQHNHNQPQPQPQPQPKQPSLIFSANAVSHFPSFRRPNPNHQTLGDYGLSVGPGGFRFADSGSNDSDKVETNDSGDAKAELSGDEEEQSNLVKNLNNKEDEGEGKRTLKLRPIKEKKVLSYQTQNAAATLPRMPVFSLSLTKAETEEDFLKMTGELPPKNVQKQMDVIFPGMSLDNVTPETYKVPDPPLKR